MKLHWDESTEIYRDELVVWLEENAPSDEEMVAAPRLSTGHLPDWARRFQRAMFDAGWLVPGWPPERGGRNASPVEQMIYFEELARRNIQRAQNPQGLSICAPSILDRGTPAQIEQWALPTLRGDCTWCVGMSEPGAGSDLASLTTRAAVLDDHFVVNGQKVWTSGAHHADLCMCFVRTDPEAPKHRGISAIVIDMKTPGIECRPLPEITEEGHADFNEVFLDDVEVPRENLVGELNDGWKIATGSLKHERAMLWINQATTFERAFHALRRAVTPTEDEVLRETLARHYVDLQALWIMGYRGFSKAARGLPAVEGSILKLYSSEAEQRLQLTAVEALHTDALDLDRVSATKSARRLPWMMSYFRTFANTIAGGTSEIQRNIIAERVLGLPRG
ncbi:MAG: acyl-CoA dehydrogenase family protein [Acidimicrobiia bacterium]|nr:acyl-CoA dehydrogenase family protein [Acidimicrobiia bacterium]